MTQESVAVRRVTKDDSKDIFTWRNDEISRRMSHATNILEWDEHSAWLEATLENQNRCLLMCFSATTNQNVAVARFDINDDAAVISINLSPSMRGKGLAIPCLKTAIAYFSSSYKTVMTIEAEIKSVNFASRKAFEAVGFQFQQEQNELRFYKLPLN